MKNMKKVVIVLLVLVVAASVVIGVAACNQPTAGEGMFVLEVRKYNGTTGEGLAETPKLDGELLASKNITVKEGQKYVSDALAEAATLEDGKYTISFGKKNYLTFSDKWWLENGNMTKESGYVADDYTYSYMACDGVTSFGPNADEVAGVKVFTIVIDGWDGEVGTTKPYIG